ncbi:MAG: hypothetical protein D6726_02760 [Nitrospirae bacterium]|nr:MAG: hypothetical protein D6726_02760 [Nitrospirota bacterium]
MRIFNVSIILFLTLLIFPPPVFSETADSIDELLKMFDDSKCKDCHEEQYRQWNESFHARAVVSSLKGMRNFFAIGVPEEWEKKLTKAEVLKCLDCHAPVVNYASNDLAVKIADMIIEAVDTKSEKKREELQRELSRLNVGCLGCHNIKATSIAKGLYGEPEKDAIYTSNTVISPSHRTIPLNTLNRSLFCSQCHGRYVAPDGEQIVCNTLNGSYYNAYISRGGLETCQDCHMKKAGRGHRFPGGHDIEIVKEGIGFNAEILGVRHTVGSWIPRAIVHVWIENRAGHRIPDG